MVQGADYLGLIKMGQKTITIKDASDQDYVVKDPQSFLNHLIQYHDVKRWTNGSSHYENDRSFNVTQSFFDDVQAKVNTLKFK